MTRRSSVMFFLAVLIPLLSLLSTTLAQQDSTCSVAKPCESGCCSSSGNCGFGPDFCGDGCQDSCNAQSECGEYAPEGQFDCPLNVCCSQWGYCGTTSGFCNDKCQNKGGCPAVERKTCDSNTDAMKSEVRIAYYGAWGASRDCDAIQPENIPAGVLTHINVAFEYITEDHKIEGKVGSIMARTSRLKRTYPGLRVNVAIGGWTFNDPPTRDRFSKMASTYPNQQIFIDSLIDYMQKYSLDGADIDWEYPAADDRGGKPVDFDNFVILCANIKKAFNSVDPGWQLTITLPSSYWYLRGFDIKRLEEHVDWFNVMTYDIHGTWDKKLKFTGPYLKGHTNTTEIEDGLDLLWRNGISPSNVVMGYGFYGRGFVMEDNSCTSPPNCRFSDPSLPGSCTNEAGILSYSEIMSRKGELGSEVFYDEESTVKWMVYGSNQWISFDDAQSFQDKLAYQSSRCLKGLMIWSLDLDSPQFQAMNDLFGEKAMADAVGDTSLSDKDKEDLVDDLAAYTGQNCFVAVGCASGGDKDDAYSTCPSGYTSVALAHDPWQLDYHRPLAQCDKGEFHHVCCPTKHAPKNCEWIGVPERNVFGCERGCGESQFELTTDSYRDPKGNAVCQTGRISLCCDSTEIVDECRWTNCDTNWQACNDDEKVQAWRLDKDNGALCEGSDRSQGLRAYCCPKKGDVDECVWSNDVTKEPGYDGSNQLHNDMFTCAVKNCPAGKLAVTKALIPHTLIDWTKRDALNCANYPNYPGVTPEYPLCCDPPSRFDDNWPVEPSYLWSDRAPDDEADVSWQWANNFGNNNHDLKPNDLESEPGSDPYGFIMLDGPAGSLNNAFDEDFTVVNRQEANGIRPRALVTLNKTLIDNVFTHSEETFQVYCNHPPDSIQCRRTFYKGAEDTIIRLPPHVGEGPWARIVSMEPDYNPDLPGWVKRKRSVTENQNGIYTVKIDYNFHLIKRDDDPVNMRVDYTNLQDYWDEITDEPTKRSLARRDQPPASFDEWRTRLDRAKDLDRKRNVRTETHHGKADFSPDAGTQMDRYSSSSGVERRWFGAFQAWLEKLNNVKAGDSGMLPMGFSKFFTLYSGRLSCTNDAGFTINAGLDITADFQLQMRTQYAYYFSGTIVPPNIIDTYAFIGSHPRMTAGLTVAGDASLTYQSPRRKIIDTLSYPGLAIKGIAAVGPSLDLWGQIEGEVKMAGSMRVGASYTFKPMEMYMPNDDDTRQRAKKELEEQQDDSEGLQPEFDANVEASVSFGVLITPEVNLGIKVGGGLGVFKKPLVDAHVSAFVNTTLKFYASVKASISTGWSYQYGVKFLYRIGFAAVAEIILYGKWQTKAYYPFPLQDIDLYGPITVSSTDANTRRSLPLWIPEEPLPGAVFDTPAQLASASAFEKNRMEAELVGSLEYASNVTSQLTRRDDQDGKFKFGDFTCTTSKGSKCAPRSLPVDKRDDSATDCPNILPRLYYNCLTYFSDFALTIPTTDGGSGRRSDMPGICSSITTFLGNWRYEPESRGTATSWTLTWENRDSARRRRRSCPSGYCKSDNEARLDTVWADSSGKKSSKDMLTNCDEFPFASTEEGGSDFYGLYPTKLTGTTRTCVPTWQNFMQGHCNNLLNNLATNVRYFNERGNPTTSNPEWKSWQQTAWTSKTGWPDSLNGGEYMQRIARYPTKQPGAPGLNAAERNEGTLSYYHKRNFTVHLAVPSNPDALSVSFPDVGSISANLRDPSDSNAPGPAVRRITDVTNVICAVNTMGQQRYRWSSYNAWCSDGQTKRPEWEGLITKIYYYSCEVTFTASAAGNTKREPIGYLGGDPIYSVERVGDEVIAVDVDPDNLPPFLANRGQEEPAAFNDSTATDLDDVSIVQKEHSGRMVPDMKMES